MSINHEHCPDWPHSTTTHLPGPLFIQVYVPMEQFLTSYLLEGAEEAFQLLHNISQLEQYGFLLSSGFHSSDGKARTLQDIYMFVKSEIQQNPSLSAKELCVRYFAHDKQFRGLVKSFQVLNQCVRSFPSLIWQGVLQQTVKKPLKLCGISTIQEDHPGVVCFAPLCSNSTPEITLRHLNRMFH